MTYAALRTALDALLPHIDPATEVSVCIQHTQAFSTTAAIAAVLTSAASDAQRTQIWILTAPTHEPSNIHRRQQS